jgi:hypothetical protein
MSVIEERTSFLGASKCESDPDPELNSRVSLSRCGMYALFARYLSGAPGSLTALAHGKEKAARA